MSKHDEQCTAAQDWEDSVQEGGYNHEFFDDSVMQETLNIYREHYETPKYDVVHNPEHYCSHPSGVEVIQITEWESFCIGNALKYILRHTKKNGKQDLEKAIWYISREIARVYPNGL